MTTTTPTTPNPARASRVPRASVASQTADRTPGRTRTPPPPLHRLGDVLRRPQTGTPVTGATRPRLDPSEAGQQDAATEKKHPKQEPGGEGRGGQAFDRLTQRQQMFVLAFASSGNATKAALEAGYSKKTAAQIGHENLRKPEIRACLAEALERAGMTAADLDARLQGLAGVDMADFEPVLNGGVTLQQLRSKGIDTRAIKRVRVKTIKRMTEDGPVSDREVTLELENPLAALIALAKLRGLLVDRSDMSVSDDVRVRLANDRAAELCGQVLSRITEAAQGGHVHAAGTGLSGQ